jgi:hypothetical protein
MKICNKCRIPQHVSNFHKNKSNKDGLARWCKVCKNRDAKNRRDKDPLYKRRIDLKRRYGLSLEEYEDIKKSQKGVCFICKETNGEKPLAVDHCHKTGKVRGLLCCKCNRALGYFKDSVINLKKAISYLEKSREEN